MRGLCMVFELRAVLVFVERKPRRAGFLFYEVVRSE